jgi:predicted transposase YbfD/YdcC
MIGTVQEKLWRENMEMEAGVALSLSEHFAALEDPRVERTKLHPLLSIVTIALCAVIAGAETWDDIAEFGEAKADWFASFLDLPHGIPSHDTFNRVFAALAPEQFQSCFLAWMQEVTELLPSQVIALDGKTVRRSHDKQSGRRAIHMVSAWASKDRLILAQRKVDDKSNEITALPELLQQLALEGCIVTIDAMGCQRDIAQKVLDRDADYVLSLKGNQGTLYQEVHESFMQAQASHFEAIAHDYAETVNKGHGRIEHRYHWVIDDPQYLAWLESWHHWPGLAAIGMVEAQRQLGADRSIEKRYYLMSRAMSAQSFGDAVRSHWGIENQVHWVLDMTFGEDQSRIRQGAAAENFVVLRHLALNLLRQQHTKRLSLKAKRLKAGWDNHYLLQVLTSI